MPVAAPLVIKCCRNWSRSTTTPTPSGWTSSRLTTNDWPNSMASPNSQLSRILGTSNRSSMKVRSSLIDDVVENQVFVFVHNFKVVCFKVLCKVNGKDSARTDDWTCNDKVRKRKKRRLVKRRRFENLVDFYIKNSLNYL